MLQRILVMTVGLLSLLPALGQVAIHDPAVRLLAKPFGIEERIRIQSIDEIHGASDGSKRLVFTLENSGVKEVHLKNPVFSFDLVLSNGKWASLGELTGCQITFPRTDDDRKVSKTYVATFNSKLSCLDIESYLKQAVRESSSMRLIGKAQMEVRSNGKTKFKKRGLKLELSGPVVLGTKFKTVKHSSPNKLPTVGTR